MSSNNDRMYFDAVVIKRLDKAVVLDIEGEEMVIPKSQLLEDSQITEDSEEGESGCLSIPAWLAQDRGLS